MTVGAHRQLSWSETCCGLSFYFETPRFICVTFFRNLYVAYLYVAKFKFWFVKSYQRMGNGSVINRRPLHRPLESVIQRTALPSPGVRNIRRTALPLPWVTNVEGSLYMLPIYMWLHENRSAHGDQHLGRPGRDPQALIPNALSLLSILFHKIC